MVRQLVRELDASEKATRDAAEQRLRKLGPGILDLLPKPDDVLSAEVKLRIRRIREQFEQDQATASTQASHVTLAGHDMPLADVLAALSSQSGNRLVDLRPKFGEAAGGKLDVHFDKTPFWPALDQVLDRSGLMLQTVSGEPGIAIANRADTQLPSAGRVSYAGAFRVEATRLVALRDLRNPTLDGLGLQLDIAWEPRLKPIALFLPGDRIQAIDEHGQPLAITGGRQELEANTNLGTYATVLPLNLVLPPRSVSRIARLTGVLRAMVPGQIAEFHFAKLEHARRVEQRQAGVTVALDSVEKNNVLWQIAIRVIFEKPGQALESHRQWIYHNEAWLQRADGEKVTAAGMETTRQSENEIGIAYLFAPGDELSKYTFVYRTPSSIANITLPFELKDLKLP